MRSTAARVCTFATAVSLSLGGAAAVGQADGRALRSFRAVYGLFQGDDRIGRAEFTLRYDRASATYVYESRSEFDGFLLRLAVPRPVIERSEFRMHRGEIRPLSYRYEDGTRGGRRNVELTFHWPERRVAVIRGDASIEQATPPTALDRATVKLALGLAVRDGRRTGRHAVADPDVFRDYRFSWDGTERIATPIGDLETYPVKHWRAESSRELTLWVAPALGFNAARIEQRRPDREPVAFALESFEWLAADGSAVAGSPR